MIIKIDTEHLTYNSEKDAMEEPPTSFYVSVIKHSKKVGFGFFEIIENENEEIKQYGIKGKYICSEFFNNFMFNKKVLIKIKKYILKHKLDYNKIVFIKKKKAIRRLKYDV